MTQGLGTDELLGRSGRPPNSGQERRRTADECEDHPTRAGTIDRISHGVSNNETAIDPGVSIHTVKSHVHNVLEKLSLRSRLEVAAFTRPGEEAQRPPPA